MLQEEGLGVLASRSTPIWHSLFSRVGLKWWFHLIERLALVVLWQHIDPLKAQVLLRVLHGPRVME